MTQLAWTIELETTAPRDTTRLWSGLGDLAFLGVIWRGVRSTHGASVRIGRLQSSIAGVDERLEIIFAVTTDTSKGYFRLDRGPSKVVVRRIIENADGDFVDTGRQITGGSRTGNTML